MGLFGNKAKESEAKLKETASINTKYIYEICKLIQDSAGVIIDMAKFDEAYIEPAKRAMEILNESVDTTGKAIAALKENDINKAAIKIEKYKIRINNLNDEVTSLMKIE